jgi:hypothetical protein
MPGLTKCFDRLLDTVIARQNLIVALSYQIFFVVNCFRLGILVVGLL